MARWQLCFVHAFVHFYKSCAHFYFFHGHFRSCFSLEVFLKPSATLLGIMGADGDTSFIYFTEAYKNASLYSILHVLSLCGHCG